MAEDLSFGVVDLSRVKTSRLCTLFLFAGQKSFEFHLRDLDLLGMSIFQRTIIRGKFLIAEH